jgi:alpha-L-fucosidase 2
VLKGKAPKFVANRDYEPKQVEYDDWNGEGMNFEVRVKLIQKVAHKKSNNNLLCENADAVTIYLSKQRVLTALTITRAGWKRSIC